MRFCKSILFLILPLGALEVQPWFGDCLEFHFLGSYSYSFFDRVQGGRPQLTSSFQSHVSSLSLDFSPTPEWSVDTEMQLADTTKQHFNFRTIAFQARYLWLDDIVGDRVSLVTGVNGRFTNTDSLRDVSCPYHANFDFEASLAMGKEFDLSDCWAWRVWGFGAVGHANRGSPWVRGIVAVETNYDDRHKFAFLAEGINGYGGRRAVLIDDFDGYAKIREKAIDLGFRYGYRLGVYGTLRFTYFRRVLARSCPAEVNAFIFSYLLPFSF
ncbi:MAG: hypothetical protein A3D96_07625 [Chlamydiae bacterium RIFCSPHIGHO2_12_FULL_44_59]|nr:MAG: hypothetical protein A2796_06935 [Chlamydiae bacterium RIFCSPHIGHO2_01_FULL_44_39]OGN59555.1 MAG: hypothetical protein A3D96_07625 [Chlamydiae bacterium RIFCSPHIGHO2_12_FULL_44_59]OGN67301.1 MAG: hypothetical protein A2978_03455 [Chlamydiae bacterium RIFCSPLOWO2_01_FULL_44_52]OGN68721.1 MAG: hypothetical protein A3I67_03185 [Chlamydiae bacterium RIFCSPLOWO2_02_FULL_45_22]OGN69243.1 MAG: hypothetical protein A3F79_04970 [Chlamydiae bacterium RIFCSPLOWO2_12_FULL_45_20]